MINKYSSVSPASNSNSHAGLWVLLTATALVLFITLCTVTIVSFIKPVPQVYWSVSEDTCVGIIIDDAKVPCTGFDFNQTYTKIWVK